MYYTGDRDKVKCFFCQVEIMSWEPEEDPIEEHLRWSPDCPLLNGQHTSNVPIHEAP